MGDGALAYDLGHFMRSLALPDAVEPWSLTTLREKLVAIGVKIVRHGRCVTFQMAAITPRQPPPGCIHHSDCGRQDAA